MSYKLEPFIESLPGGSEYGIVYVPVKDSTEKKIEKMHASNILPERYDKYVSPFTCFWKATSNPVLAFRGLDKIKTFGGYREILRVHDLEEQPNLRAIPNVRVDPVCIDAIVKEDEFLISGKKAIQDFHHVFLGPSLYVVPKDKFLVQNNPEVYGLFSETPGFFKDTLHVRSVNQKDSERVIRRLYEEVSPNLL
ncbi:MAG: hypothetical protein ACMXYK_01810 [Candidatus Woesearchaeota archaeon]